MPKHTNSGTIAQANDAVTIADIDRTATVVVFDIDSVTASLNISFEASYDGTDWDAIEATRTDAAAGGTAVSITVGNAQSWRYTADLRGATAVRARCSAYTSGTCTAAIHVT